MLTRSQYTETINDLLGKGEFDKKKHEIHHDKSGRTSVDDVNVIPLTSPNQVRSLLSLAQSRRTVASTLMNERHNTSIAIFGGAPGMQMQFKGGLPVSWSVKCSTRRTNCA